MAASAAACWRAATAGMAGGACSVWEDAEEVWTFWMDEEAEEVAAGLVDACGSGGGLGDVLAAGPGGGKDEKVRGQRGYEEEGEVKEAKS